ncbi:hypothetical protein OF820_06345 [Oceanotoga sp. DSM 15011]|uniref:hypothetical protein n=1 Tax=Oceanotoga sp. DSM 15011 TaxID=2984951 RepID=UPI0021F43189|nr:hypothetical protein [Oceanotoga sp. DSM 15011]UYP01304.1 hypothetical protein OF820_06345 [Oceanotoga sp. DSM 15011]
MEWLNGSFDIEVFCFFHFCNDRSCPDNKVNICEIQQCVGEKLCLHECKIYND